MKNTTYLFLAVLLICAGCPDQDKFDPDREIRIVNSSAIDLVELRTVLLQNDTLLPISSPFTDQNFIESATIVSGLKISIPVESETISEYGLMLYLFSRDTIEQVSWERIVDEYLVLRRYDLTLEDLEAMDWTVEYK
ncbi:MAG: hypothetical protein AAF620_16650 [Bacteroidota bacterium]